MDKRTKRLFWAVLGANMATIVLKWFLNYLLNIFLSNLSFNAAPVSNGQESEGMMAMHFDIEGKEGVDE